jgi:hypothetical protein
MKLKLVASLLLLIGITAQAGQKYRISLDKNITTSQEEKAGQSFIKFSFGNSEVDRNVGAPELPVKSWLVRGTPAQIKVSVKANDKESFQGAPYPVQEQDCRCAVQKIKTFQYKQNLYANPANPVSVTYLGAFRGQPISRVDVRLGSYNAETNETVITTEADVLMNNAEFSLPRGADLKDYLIVTTPALADGAADFINWKRSQGYNVSVETVSSPNNTTAAVQALIKSYYADKGVDFVIIIGDESTIPMFQVNTSGSSKTPSDLPYYTMDGASDYVPDVYASRIVATTAEQASAQLAKSIEYEQHAWGSNKGLNKYIGIASSEGSNPSDDQYVKAIEAKFVEVQKSEVVHLWQKDAANSKPAVLNANLNNGAAWITYVGHGSGTSWPSMAQSYSTTNVLQLANKAAVKPIIIDVACQNGRLIGSNLGSTFMKADGNALGAVAYYGGSVNISWHPPAIMAQGIAFEHLSKHYSHLGEALLAGQLYLAGKWTKQEEVIDNMEWYHLQGDPGLNISF